MPWSETALRLFLAALLSGCIGYERERHGRAAGLRTHILVCIGSTLVMLTGMYLSDISSGRTSVDPTRMGAQVISGIGFLGAGAILRFKASVRGLTTAASLWAVAGLGLAVGSGFYVGASIATAIMLLVLFALPRMEAGLRKDWYPTLLVEGRSDGEVLARLRAVLNEFEAEIKDLDIHPATASKAAAMQFHLRLPTERQREDVLREVGRIDGVVRAVWRTE